MKNKRSIKKLPPHLIDQIAAGEVIERPSSVVKELIENSLDADSSEIEIQIKGGGLELISVQDDGWGIDFDELPSAISRHATSKIYTFEDLEKITSFGFRGEALPSIAAVSKLELYSSTENELGGKIVVEYGKIISHTPYVMNKGTLVKVKNIFLNTPARLKFLKSKTYERKRCEDIVYKLSLANLNVEFKLITEKKYTLFTKNQTLEERLKLIWGEEVINDLIPIKKSDGKYRIYGFISNPNRIFHTSEKILTFINNRFVQNKTVLNAIRAGYKGKILTREYPYAVVFIFIPSEDIDINVHPAKLDVRFKDENIVFSLIYHAINKNIAEKTLYFKIIEDLSYNNKNNINLNQEQKILVLKENKDNNYTYNHNKKQNDVNRIDIDINYICQLYDNYLFFFQNNIPVLLDQHAAHERVLYHRYRSTVFKSIILTIPINIYLEKEESTFFQNNYPLFERLGFEMEIHNDRMVLKKIPEFLSTSEAKNIVKSCIESRIDSLDKFWKLTACKKAIKAGEKLSKENALKLIKMWLLTPEKEFCPHGRPTSLVFSLNFLESLFKRK